MKVILLVSCVGIAVAIGFFIMEKIDTVLEKGLFLEEEVQKDNEVSKKKA